MFALQNVMVDRQHQLKLIDFGLSKHLQSAKTLGVGTPDYMCPELVRAAGDARQHPQGGGALYDGRSVDAWALGVLMYLLTTGRYPFEVRLGAWKGLKLHETTA